MESLLKHWHLDNPENIRTIIAAAKKNQEPLQRQLSARKAQKIEGQTKKKIQHSLK